MDTNGSNKKLRWLLFLFVLWNCEKRFFSVFFLRWVRKQCLTGVFSAQEHSSRVLCRSALESVDKSVQEECWIEVLEQCYRKVLEFYRRMVFVAGSCFFCRNFLQELNLKKLWEYRRVHVGACFNAFLSCFLVLDSVLCSFISDGPEADMAE